MNLIQANIEGFVPEADAKISQANLDVIDRLLARIMSRTENFDTTKFEDIPKVIDAIHADADTASQTVAEMMERIKGEGE